MRSMTVITLIETYILQAGKFTAEKQKIFSEKLPDRSLIFIERVTERAISKRPPLLHNTIYILPDRSFSKLHKILRDNPRYKNEQLA